MSNKINIFSVKNFCFSLFVAVLTLLPAKTFAYEPVEEVNNHDEVIDTASTAVSHTEEHSKAFNAAEMIIEHIGDSHQWQ